MGELRTLQTQDTSDPGLFGTSLVGPNCLDISALVPKSPTDSSDLSAELSWPVFDDYGYDVRLGPQVANCPPSSDCLSGA